MKTPTLDTEIIGRIHEAFNRRDFDALAGELTEDVVFHQIPGLEGAPPTTQGRDAVMELFGFMSQLGDQRVEHRNTEALADFVVGVGTAIFDVQGTEERFQIIDVCRLRDGKLAERWAMLDDPAKAESIMRKLT